MLCDICTHVRGNPIGVMGKKVDLNKFHGRVEKVASVAPDPDSKHGWCEICSQKTGPGLTHPCTPESRRRNICKLIEIQEDKDKQKIVGNSLKNMAEKIDRRKANLELCGVGPNNKKLKVSIGKQDAVQAKIKVDTFKKIEKDMDISRNATLHLKRILQRDVPVEKGVREKLREWDHLSDDQHSSMY